jgi:hypothetical protein
MEGIEAIVLPTIDPQPTLWEAILPQQCLGLPAGLDAVDRLLDDPVFSNRIGRISTLRSGVRRSRSRRICG